LANGKLPDTRFAGPQTVVQAARLRFPCGNIILLPKGSDTQTRGLFVFGIEPCVPAPRLFVIPPSPPIAPVETGTAFITGAARCYSLMYPSFMLVVCIDSHWSQRVQVDTQDARTPLRNVERAADCDNDIDAVRKDIHLVHAALAVDRSIVSRDETARRLFGNASAAVPDLSSIVSVNPDREAETPIERLENGAVAEP
jgi:hypothetical protein